MTSSFRLDLKGGAEVLNIKSVDAVNALAHQIGDQAGADAEVDPYTTDRAAAAVTVPAERQAKDGALTRAAAAVGLEVRPK
jgi:hypothetical protein